MVEVWMLLLALGVDLLLGEPPARLHPVVGMGQLLSRLAQRAPRRRPLAQLLYGTTMVLMVAGAFGGGAWLLLAWLASWDRLLYLVVGVFLLTSTFSVRGLWRMGHQVTAALQAERLEEARRWLRALVSRDTASLDGPHLASAAVESLAENLSDSVVAPLCYFVLLGVPGALAYRAVNTADAMFGYRGATEYVGKGAARLDDLLNLVPARLSALLLVLAALLSGKDVVGAFGVLWREHGKTESPNAGWPMSAAAGALGVRLEKVKAYSLGEGLPLASAQAIPAMLELALAAVFLAAYLALLLSLVRYVGVPAP